MTTEIDVRRSADGFTREDVSVAVDDTSKSFFPHKQSLAEHRHTNPTAVKFIVGLSSSHFVSSLN